MKYENGNANIIPSTLSSIPPWPGNILPVSLIFAFRLRYEINRSPTWLTKEIKTINTTDLKVTAKSKYSSCAIIKNGIKLNIKEPIVPETVLFGLILVNFFPPMEKQLGPLFYKFGMIN